ncbi:copper homeostasis protein CutC [Agrobacterium vitis]|uniref:PF03932 family protein CutC n=1 Tax=Agrobacterium vitis TaxID=373 RepID=A0A368P094_AGRVI|nr:copper homeostasis protein CutC [Agrobacterium vitis]KAA3511380.1 copper homeostasis protein CutC [Agrobacterium vitis]KAA3528090.1 copper homeostasis protein CutC [Agrobacterium vitis]MCF1478480.1 copper homeostasis protein CutC [Agrobacterium vitis]MUZ96641.1 copper homeostasis protein CutC [Agrobacterium vitis]MVA28506.1 copper homeostasis protein CutC [Agrobacterium vitis]
MAGSEPEKNDGGLLEVCVDSVAGLEAAIAGGADRIELCAALDCGGLTPTSGLMQRAAQAPIPVFAMIRPRAGSFVFSPDEVTVMVADIQAAQQAGLAGVVLGASRSDGCLDVEVLGHLTAVASGLAMTLHRAFDLVPDFEVALEQAIALGFGRILTSGGEQSVVTGFDRLKSLSKRADGRITIMPGGGLRPERIAPFWQAGLREFHASCSVPIEADPVLIDFGFATVGQARTDSDVVRRLAAAIETCRTLP